MPRAFRFGNYGVFVPQERGQPHNLPHAHVKYRGQLVASVFLLTLTVYRQHERLPEDLLVRLREAQAEMLVMWEKLNDGD
jgi:hypothetical protein